jgi:putative DNA primase/helicase
MGLAAVEDTTNPKMSSESFRIDDAGVYWKDPGGRFQWLSGKVEIVAMTRDADGGNWGRWLRWRDGDGRVHEWAMPLRMLATDSSDVRGYLMEHGLAITTNYKLREHFAEYLQTFSVQLTICCVSRTGWYEDGFVLPDEYIAKDSRRFVFQSQHSESDRLGVAGTLGDWQEHVGKFCSGNSRLVLAVSMGFAGPLLGLLDEESGGIHLWGRTSNGKTTAAVLGGSVLGGGTGNGFVRSWNSTANGVEAQAEKHNHLTLFLDEIGQVDGRTIPETIYCLVSCPR